MVFEKQWTPETQRPCARLRDAALSRSAPGDPAMVFMFRMASILPMVRASYPLRPAAGLLLDTIAHDLLRKPEAIPDQVRGWLLRDHASARTLQVRAPGRRMI